MGAIESINGSKALTVFGVEVSSLVGEAALVNVVPQVGYLVTVYTVLAEAEILRPNDFKQGVPLLPRLYKGLEDTVVAFVGCR